MGGKSLFTSVVLLGILQLTMQQRVAPGVPPQQYNPDGFQQPPPPPNYQQQQHHQQQQQQFQQHPQQGVNMNQGVPVQHHQAMQGHGQVPAQPPQHAGHAQIPPQQGGPPPPGQPPQGHHGHHGHHGGPPQQLLDASNVAKEREHIQEHMDVPIDTSNMSEQELQFHYFKMHDADNNNKLDGCELVKSLIHWHDQANHDPQAGVPIPEAKVFNDEELSNMIDPILANDDKNKDGFIDYGEFVRAQATAANRASQHAA